MEPNIRAYLTLRGMIGASLFMISGLIALYISYSRISIIETVIEVVCLLVVAPAACLWINHNPTSTSQQSSVSQ
jgi:hypothetical protein